MKKLLSLFLTAAIACSLAVTASAAEEPAAAASDPDLTGSIVILHTNDVHGGIAGYAQVAAQKQYYQKCGAYVLLFDAGDFIQGDPTVSASQGETAVELMNLAGYDAAALGNHEFDYGYDNLVKLSRTAKFPILSANTPEGLATAIITGNEKALTVAPGVGKKIAQRVLLELKDKLAKGQLPAAGESYGGSGLTVIPQDKTSEATAALAVLGYGPAEINMALKGLDLAALSLEDIVRQALKKMLK